MLDAERWEKPFKGAAGLLVWVVAVSLCAALSWAAVAKVSVYAQVIGTLTPSTQPFQVNLPSGGRIVSGELQLWQTVRKGQVLFTLDTLTRDPQDAALQLAVQQNAATQARQDIAAVQIDLLTKQQAEQSARILFKLGGISLTDMSAATSAVRTAQATLQKASSQLSAAQAQLALLARNQRLQVLSPVNGQVMQLADLHVGQAVSAGQNVLAILPQGVPLIFRGSAAETDRPKLRPHSKVQIAWSSYPRQKYGVSDGVLQGVSPTSTVDSSGKMTYQVEVNINSLGQRPQLGGHPLLPGMAGEAHVLSNKKTVLGLFWDWVRGADPWS